MSESYTNPIPRNPFVGEDVCETLHRSAAGLSYLGTIGDQELGTCARFGRDLLIQGIENALLFEMSRTPAGGKTCE
jgi:hypothetical protein